MPHIKPWQDRFNEFSDEMRAKGVLYTSQKQADTAASKCKSAEIAELRAALDAMQSAPPQQDAIAALPCRHANREHLDYDHVICTDCGWVTPSGEHRGPHRGWFPSPEAVKAWDKYKTYPGMAEHLATPPLQQAAGEAYAAAEFASWQPTSTRYRAFCNGCPYCMFWECTSQFKQPALEQDWDATHAAPHKGEPG